MAGTLTTAIDRLTNRLISVSLRQDADVWRHAKRIAVLNLAFALWVGLYAGICAVLGAWPCGLLTLSTFLPILVSLWALKRGASPVVCGNITCLGGWTMMTTIAALSGGGVATPLLWYSVLPVLATMASGMVWGLAWTVACIVSIGLFALAGAWGMPFPQQFSPRSLDVFGFTLIVGLVICQFVMAVVRVGVEQRALAALHEARRRLANVRRDLDTLQAVYGFSMDDWARVQREKAALERFVRLKYGKLDLVDSAVDDETADDALDELDELDELDDLRADAEAALSAARTPGGGAAEKPSA